jgi:hypothetical protein
LSDGGVKLTRAVPLIATTDSPVGASGSAIGVTLADGADAAEGPIPFVATTVNVYAVPFVSPYTVIGLVVPVPVSPPGLDVTL